MKTLIKKIALFLVIISPLLSCEAQVKNAKTETIKIYGNCGMCEKKIEEAGYKEGVVNIDWDQDTKMAIITYDRIKTTLDEVLQRIAAVGYDSDEFRASDEKYNNLHECCHYERPDEISE